MSASPSVSREEAERRVSAILAQPGSLWKDWVVASERTRATDVGWIVWGAPARPPEAPESWRNVQAALFPDRPPDPGPIGAGPFIVAHDGAVFGTGSAFPAEAYCEDVRVMTGMTWHPLRVARYVARRLFDGRTAFRLSR